MSTLQYQNSNHSDERRQKIESPKLQKGLGAIASSLNYIGGTIGNAIEVSFHWTFSANTVVFSGVCVCVCAHARAYYTHSEWSE